MKIVLNIIFATVLFSSMIIGQTKPVAFVGAKIYTANNLMISNGVLIISDGKIVIIFFIYLLTLAFASFHNDCAFCGEFFDLPFPLLL